VEKVRWLRRCPRDPLLSVPDNSPGSRTHGARQPKSIDEGIIHSEQNVYTVYDDPRRSEWIVKIQPALKKAKLKILVRLCKNKLSRREVIELRAGRKKPHRKTQELLAGVLATGSNS
jgi:hypothetical protein